MNIEDPNAPVEGDIEIVIPDEEKQQAEAGAIVVETPKKPEPKIIEPDEGIAKLKEKLEAETRAKGEAQQRANELAQSEHKARQDAQSANTNLIASAIDKRKQDAEILKANLASAYEAQDFTKVADIQMEMATAAADLRVLEQGRQTIESQPKPPAPQVYTADPVEEAAQNIARAGSPRSADWVRAHPEYVTNQANYQKMVAAHNWATANGATPDSDDYFDRIETMLGIQQQPSGDAQVQRRQAPASAPVSRTGAAPGTNPRRVTLSAEEREMAAMMKMTDQEYAREKLAIMNSKPN